jgi:hypothetical protein
MGALGKGTKNLSVNVPQTLYAELEQLAKASGLKVGAYVRAVLLDAIKNGALVVNETTVQTRRAWAKADDAGLIEQYLAAADRLPASGRKRLDEMRKEAGYQSLSDFVKVFGLHDPATLPVDWSFSPVREMPFRLTKKTNPRNPRT